MIAKPVCRLILLAALLLGTGLSVSLSAQNRKAKKHTFTLVLDPGHGGKDAGACGNGGKEKNINLAVALEVMRLVKAELPEIKVLATRTDDRFIGLSERARFANRNNADLFISIHTNSAENRSAKGIETYILGLHRSDDNLRVAMKENQSILLEDNYREKYQSFDPSSTESYIIFDFIQKKHLDQSLSAATYVQQALVPTGNSDRGVRQAGFLVIRETAMPSILIELGFISNKADAGYLLSSAGQKQMAKAIARGISRYYTNWKKAGK